MMHWIVRVYDGDNVVADWVIPDRTEYEASGEAESEVEQHHPGLDWTLSPLAYTPGPWFHDDEFCIGTKGGGNTIAMTGQDPQLTKAEHEVNARAIAALPDVLTALKEMYAQFEANADYADDDKAVIKQAAAAIKQITGE